MNNVQLPPTIEEELDSGNAFHIFALVVIIALAAMGCSYLYSTFHMIDPNKVAVSNDGSTLHDGLNWNLGEVTVYSKSQFRNMVARGTLRYGRTVEYAVVYTYTVQDPMFLRYLGKDDDEVASHVEQHITMKVQEAVVLSDTDQLRLVSPFWSSGMKITMINITPIHILSTGWHVAEAESAKMAAMRDMYIAQQELIKQRIRANWRNVQAMDSLGIKVIAADSVKIDIR